MALVTPLLKGALTEWCDSLLVEGALPGAIVIARTIGPDPRDIAKDVVSGGRARLPLRAGAKLRYKDRIVVQQVTGDGSSGWTPDHLAAFVGAAPKDHGTLAPLSFHSHVWACGAALWVKGAVPGATVTVTGPGGGVLGSGRATQHGDARLSLAATTPSAGRTIKAHQEAPPGFPPLAGAPKVVSEQVKQLPVGPLHALPAPTFGGPPPKGCDPSLLIGGVYDGAEVTILRRSDGSTETATFDYDELNFILATPLSNTGDKLEITQAMPRCEIVPSEPLEIDVAPASKPGTPVLRPPCAGSVDVFVGNLLGGAIVTLGYDNAEYRGCVPPSDTSFVFRLAPFASGKTVTAKQERCGLSSDEAAETVPGVSPPNGSAAPDLREPLFGCARVARALATPGTWLQIWAKTSGGEAPISGQVFAMSDSVPIDVAPYLVEGQAVWLSYLLCGSGAWESSPRHTVSAAPDLGDATIVQPLVEGATRVAVDAVPGAAINVYAMTGWPIKVARIGSGFGDPIVGSVHLTRLLTQRDMVFAEQVMCRDRPGVGALRSVLPAVRT